MKRLVLSLFCLIVGTSVFGSSVVRLTLADISDHSGQILIGTVASLESYWIDEYGPRTIETTITLEQVSFLKGQRNSVKQFEFTVPGGTVGGMTMRIAGAPEFKKNETWLFFLLPEWKSFPTVGLYQGAYQLTDGIVKDGNGVPVASIDEKGFVISALAPPTLEGRAHGANVHVHSSVRPMKQLDFLHQVASIANKSKAIKLQHNAGKRIKADYTSVSVKEKQ